MSILSICQTIAEKIKSVYAKGKTDGAKEEHGRFWDAFQNYGNRTSYMMAFANTTWNDGDFYPKHDIKPEGSIMQMFYYSKITNIAQRLNECGVTLDTSKATVFMDTFASAETSEIPTLDLSSATNATRIFQNAKNLTKAPLKNISKASVWTNSFSGCSKLTDIGQESDDFGYFSASVNLSQTAIRFDNDKMSLILATHFTPDGNGLLPDNAQSVTYLKVKPSTTQTLTLSADQIAQAQAHMDAVTGGTFTFDFWVIAHGWALAEA